MKKNLFFLVLIVATLIFTFNSKTTAQLFQKSPPVLKLGDPMPGNLFVELAKAINPSVVNISTSVVPRGRQYRDPMMEMLEQFYGRPLQPRGTQPGQPGKPRRVGLGTGFIIREDGLIVTNNHVIQGADIIEVQLTENSDKQYKAEVIGSDERTDLALIKIKADIKLTAVAMGSSENTEVGEWVAAFGNPYGHGHSMSKGIISSKGREIEEVNRLPLLQTDASINPGNSGGPLVNSKGYVIGVNSAIDARAQGIGFAIPIDEVKKIIPQLEERGTVRKGYLGLGLGDIDDQVAYQMGLDEYRGAVVMSLGIGPGKKAGVKLYDIITEYDGKKIKYSRDLIDMVYATEPGRKVRIKVLRNERPLNLDIVIAERPEEKRISQKFESEEVEKPTVQKKSSDQYNIGLEISDITKKIRETYNLNEEIYNPVITNVNRNSLAYRAGLREGDVILSLNKIEPKTAAQAQQAFKKGTNSIRVARGRGLSAITFDIP